jgi:hypothetical protein
MGQQKLQVVNFGPANGGTFFVSISQLLFNFHEQNY